MLVYIPYMVYNVERRKQKISAKRWKGEKMNVGENIKAARKAAGVTQAELAERLGVYQKDISRWEKGEIQPNLGTFADICRALAVSADMMLELKEYCN